MSLPSPEEFFGFKIGEDKKLARWDKIVEYYKLLAEKTPRVKVLELGKTVNGNPFILTIITSPRNMERLDEIREISKKLAYPEGLREDDVEKLVKKGVAIVAVSGSLHATEVSGAQMLVELAYELSTRSDSEVGEILENVVLLVFPCLNPDGQIMVVDWYYKTLGTEHEGSPPPWLYHRYCGHDNNRDAYMLTQPESQYFAKVVYREWIPQVYIDHHQMQTTAARFFISPEMDPIYPDIDPLVWREIQFLGTYAASRLARKGFKGVETSSPFTPDFTSAFQTILNYMNIVGMLTESASVKIASPIYIHPHQLKGYYRGRKSEKPQMNYPDPWPGGWWRLRNIVEYQKEATYAILEAISRFKSEILYNMYVKAKRSILKGREEPPYAYIIPRKQQDYLTMLKMVRVLRNLGIKVHIAEEELEAEGRIYPKGTMLVFMAQPRRPLAKKLLEPYRYPDNEFTRDREGNPIKPYDIATERLPDLMGVQVEEVKEKLSGKFREVTEKDLKVGIEVSESKHGWLLDPRLNDTHWIIVNLVLEGYRVFRIPSKLEVEGSILPPGAFYIPVDQEVEGVFEKLKSLALKIGVKPIPLRDPLSVEGYYKVSIPKIGVYQRYYGGNMDEGWLRWFLENYNVPYKVIGDDVIKEDRLKDEVELLILPSDPLAMMTGENVEEELSKIWKRPVKLPPWPPEYLSGFKQEGIEKIKKFVEEGGKLITLGAAYEILTKGFKLPIRDLTEEIKDPKKFFCPGSTLRAVVDVEHPIGWGMPREVKVLFIDKPILEVIASYENEKYVEVVRFLEENLLSSGWLIGEEYLARKPIVLDISLGRGEIVLHGIRPHFRGQTHGTFKLLLNSLYVYDKS